MLDELRALLEEVEPTENPLKDRGIAFLNKFDGRIVPPPPRPQDDPSHCKSCDGVMTMDRLYTPTSYAHSPIFPVETRMRARWIIIALAVGMYLAWRDQNTIAGHLTVIGCTIAYGLRKIEWKLMAIERELSKSNAEELDESDKIGGDSSLPIFQGYRVRRVPDETFVTPPPMQTLSSRGPRSAHRNRPATAGWT